MKRNFHVTLALLTLGASLSGCVSPLDKPGGLVNAWAERFRDLQIYPVFPPREDFQVGDIYLVCEMPQRGLARASAQTQAVPVPVAQFMAATPGVRGALEAFYRRRVVYPEGNNSNKSTHGQTSNGADTSMPQHEMFSATSETDRLRNVSFPELLSVTASRVNVAGLLPAGSFLASVGLTSDDVASVTISIPSAGSYGLPGNQIEPLLASVNIDQPNELLKAYAQADCRGYSAEYIVISEVYLAYAMSVHIDFSSAGAAKVEAGLKTASSSMVANPSSTVSKLLANSAPSGQTGTNANGATASGAALSSAPSATTGVSQSSAGDVAKLASSFEDLAKALESQTQFEYPGVHVAGYSGSATGISLERKFVNPVVIGYRGYSVTFPDSTESVGQAKQQVGRAPGGFVAGTWPGFLYTQLGNPTIEGLPGEGRSNEGGAPSQPNLPPRHPVLGPIHGNPATLGVPDQMGVEFRNSVPSENKGEQEQKQKQEGERRSKQKKGERTQ